MAQFVGSKLCHAAKCRVSCTCLITLKVMRSLLSTISKLLTRFQKGFVRGPNTMVSFGQPFSRRPSLG